MRISRLKYREEKAKDLHAKQSKDEDEEDEEDEQSNNGRNWVNKGLYQTTHGFPVPVKETCILFGTFSEFQLTL